MKRLFILSYTVLFTLCMNSCANLDLEPLAQASTEDWYTNEEEINLSLNDLYRSYVWDTETGYKLERYTDNWNERQTVYDYAAGTITSEWTFAKDNWLFLYKGIARCNNILDNIDRLASAISPEKAKIYQGEARFMRAAIYSKLVFLLGRCTLSGSRSDDRRSIPNGAYSKVGDYTEDLCGF